MTVQGTGERNHPVVINNASSGQVLDTTTVKNNNEWQLKLTELALVPCCQIRIESENELSK